MNEHTEVQIIKHNGQPAFAVIPYEEYLRLTSRPADEHTYIPHDVVGMHIAGDSMVKAWRKYLNITQAVLAEKMNLSQPAIAQIERSEDPHSNTLLKVAKAMGIDPELLKY